MLILYGTIGLSFVSYMRFRSIRLQELVGGHPPFPLFIIIRSAPEPAELPNPIFPFLEVSPEREQLLQQIQTKLDLLAGGV